MKTKLTEAKNRANQVICSNGCSSSTALCTHLKTDIYNISQNEIN